MTAHLDGFDLPLPNEYLAENIDWTEVDFEERADRVRSVQFVESAATQEQLRRVAAVAQDDNVDNKNEISNFEWSKHQAQALFAQEHNQRIHEEAEWRPLQRIQHKLDRERNIAMVTSLAEIERERRIRETGSERPNQAGMQTILRALKERRLNWTKNEQFQQETEQKESLKKQQEEQEAAQRAWEAQQRAAQIQAKLQAAQLTQQQEERKQRKHQQNQKQQQRQLQAQQARQLKQHQFQQRQLQLQAEQEMQAAFLASSANFPPLHRDEVRSHKNNKEKMRRDNINSKYDELCEVLELEPTFKKRKVDILEEALIALKDMKQQLAQAQLQMAQQQLPFEMANQGSFSVGFTQKTSPTTSPMQMQHSSPVTSCVSPMTRTQVHQWQQFPPQQQFQQTQPQQSQQLQFQPTHLHIPPLQPKQSLELDLFPEDISFEKSAFNFDEFEGCGVAGEYTGGFDSVFFSGVAAH